MLGLGVGLPYSSHIQEFTLSSVSDLAVWLQNGVGITTAKWDDSSGSSNHASQSTEGNRGTVSGGGLDLERDSDNFYELANKIDIVDNQGFCAAFVVTRESETAGTVFSDNLELLQFQSSSTFRIFCNNNAGNVTTVTTAVFPNNPFEVSTKTLVLVNRTAGTPVRYTFFVNGTQLTPDVDLSANEAPGENPHGIEFQYLGSTGNGVGDFFDGIIHEAAIWSKGLNAKEIADVNSYLKSFHNIN